MSGICEAAAEFVWNHDALAEDLAGYLRGLNRMVWVDMQLGPSGSPRPDVYTMFKSFRHPHPIGYECKVTREDFRADVTVGKWCSYLNYAHGVIFAAPAGLISKAELPEICGLIQRHEKSWRLAKRPVLNPKPIAQETLLKLVIDGVHREGPAARRQQWEQSAGLRRFEKKFGAVAARYVDDFTRIEDRLEAARLQAERILNAAIEQAANTKQRMVTDGPVEWARLCEVLGLPLESSIWTVRDSISRLRRDTQGGQDGVALRRVLKQLEGIIESEHINRSPVSI